MKLLACILSVALSAATLHAQPEPAPTPQPKGALLITFCIVAVLAGAGIVIYVYSSKPIPQDTPVRLVLLKSYDNVNWEPVVTNTVILNHAQNWVELFSEQQRADKTAFYWAKLAK